MQIYNTMMYFSRKVEPKSAVNLIMKVKKQYHHHKEVEGGLIFDE